MPQYQKQSVSGTNPFFFFFCFFSSFCSLFFLFFLIVFFWNGHSFTHAHAHTYELITRKFFTARDHLYVGCAERRQSCSSSRTEEEREREGDGKRNEQRFPFLERSPPARSLAFLLVSFPIALVSCTKNSLTCPVAHSIVDLKIVAWFSL